MPMLAVVTTPASSRSTNRLVSWSCRWSSASVHSLTRAFQLSVELAQRALGGLALALGEVHGNEDHTLLLPRRVDNRDLLDG
ncbi:MAG: hypothetical protein ACXV5Q_14500 [Frankiaceae bacterium]